MKSIKVGDDVRVYHYKSITECIIEGECIEIRGDILTVRHYDGGQDKIIAEVFHRKQCRKIGKEKTKIPTPKRFEAYIGRSAEGQLGHFSFSRETLEKRYPTVLRLIEIASGECIIPTKNLPLPNETYITKEQLFDALGNYLWSPGDSAKNNGVWKLIEKSQRKNAEFVWDQLKENR